MKIRDMKARMDWHSFKCFAVWFICLAAGGAAILLNQNTLLITLLAVAVYIVYLLIAERALKQVLSHTTKDSPYFLGFMFTLIAIVNIFWELPDRGDNLRESLQTFLIPQVGAALLSTIIGLAGRQLILSLDPAETEGERLFRSAAEELGKGMAVYRQSQEAMLRLIEDFSVKHRQLLVEEEQAVKQHHSSLDSSSKTLKRLNDDLGRSVKSLTGAVDTIRAKFEDFVAKTLIEMHTDLMQRTRTYLEKVHGNFAKSAEDSFARMQKSFSMLERQAGTAERAMREVFQRFPELQKQLVEESADEIRRFRERCLADLNASVDGVTERFARFDRELGAVADTLPQRYGEVIEKSIAHLDEIQERYAGTLDGRTGEVLKSLGELKRGFEDLGVELHARQMEVHAETARQLEAMQAGFQRQIERDVTLMGQKFSELALRVAEIGDHFQALQVDLFENSAQTLEKYHEDYLRKLSVDAEEMQSNLNAVQGDLKGLAEGFNECRMAVNNGFRETLDGIVEEMRGLQNAVGQTSENVSTSGKTVSEIVQNLHSHYTELNGEIQGFGNAQRSLTRLLGGEIQQINQLMDDFIEVLRTKVSRDAEI